MLVLAGALYLGECDVLTISTCVWQFPLIALGMALLLVCDVSPRLPFHASKSLFLASIAYSVYLSHKLVIHFAISVCQSRGLLLTSAPAWFLLELLIHSAGALLFFAVERPFLQLRRRLAP